MAIWYCSIPNGHMPLHGEWVVYGLAILLDGSLGL
jgi:hypothetical protein